MRMIVTIAGNALIVMYMPLFNNNIGTCGYAVIVFMPMVEGYITDDSMGVA